MGISFHIIGAVVLLFIVRVLPMISFARCFAPSDVLAHSFMVEFGRIDRRKLLDAGRQYPIYFHLLLSFLPLGPNFLRAAVPFFSDALVLLAVGMVLSDFVNAGLIGTGPAIITLYLFSLYPAHTAQFFGTRNYGLNERVGVEALFSLTVLLLIFAPSIETTIISTVLLVFLLISSKFSIQAILLVLLPAGFIMSSTYIAASIAAAFAISFAIPQIQFGTKLRKQYAHLKRYVSFLQEPGNWAGARNKIPRMQPSMSAAGYLFTIAKFIGRDNAITVGLIGHGLMLLGVAVFMRHWDFNYDPLNSALILVMVGVAAWLITSFGIFKILGEAERYLNYVVAPGFIVIAFSIDKAQPPLPLIAAIFILLIIFWIMWMIYLWKVSLKHKTKRDRIERLIEQSGMSTAPGNIVSLTSVYECWLLLETFGERFWWFKQFFYADWKNMFRYPHLKYDAITCGDYTLLVADETSLAALEREEPRYGDIRQWPLLAKLDDLYVFQIAVSESP